MKKIALLLPAFCFFFTAAVSAHGPVRQKLEEEITINAPAEKVWAIIKNYGDMSWLPAVKGTTVEGSNANAKGAIRVLSLKDGGTITEELKKYDDKKMSYAYKITDMSTAKTINYSGADEKIPVLPVTDYAASIDLEDNGPAATKVSWKAGYYRAYMNNNPPDEMNEEAANKAVSAILRAGLENLKTLAEK